LWFKKNDYVISVLCSPLQEFVQPAPALSQKFSENSLLLTTFTSAKPEGRWMWRTIERLCEPC